MNVNENLSVYLSGRKAISHLGHQCFTHSLLVSIVSEVFVPVPEVRVLLVPTDISAIAD